jgi:tetratricopeptide (TPR) repeat protein
MMCHGTVHYPGVEKVMLTIVRYLHHNDTTDALQMVLEVYFEADSICQEEERDNMLHAHLLNISGLTDLTNGEFVRAEKRFLDCKEIRAKILPANDSLMININSNIGLAYGCQENWSKSIAHLEEAIRLLQSWDEPSPVKKVLVYTNIGKIYGLSKAFDKSEQYLGLALKSATALRTVFWTTA